MSYRDLAKMPEISKKELEFKEISPDSINGIIDGIKNGHLNKKGNALPDIILPELQSLWLWKFRLKLETKALKKEYIKLMIANKRKFIHIFNYQKAKFPTITFYALNEFYKAGWTVKIHFLLGTEIKFGDMPLNELYSKLGRATSFYVYLEDQQ